MSTMTLKIEPLTLNNINDGELERSFQEALAEVAAAFSIVQPGDEIPWELTHGKATCKVQLNIAVTHDFDTGTSIVKTDSKLTMPKRRGALRPVMIRDGAVFCEPSGTQLTMWHGKENEEVTND